MLCSPSPQPSVKIDFMAWRAIPGPLSKRKRRLDSLEAAQGAPSVAVDWRETCSSHTPEGREFSGYPHLFSKQSAQCLVQTLKAGPQMNEGVTELCSLEGSFFSCQSLYHFYFQFKPESFPLSSFSKVSKVDLIHF